jgi:RNA polymerase sigma-70 factor, ECF subfamily
MSMTPNADPLGFFNEFYPKVTRFISKASGAPREDVEDLVQETLLIAWRQRSGFQGESSFETWVLAIAKNRVRRRFRGDRRREDAVDALAALAALESEDLPEDVLRAEELGRHVRRALGEIDEGHVRVLVLRYVEGWTVARIATELGESEKAVESRLTRAREGLRKRLKGTEQNVATG